MFGRKRDTWRAVVSALIVATGMAVAWGLLCGWIGTSISALLSSDRQIREHLIVAADGTPVIVVQSTSYFSDNVTLSRRTIDGKDFPSDYEHWLSGAYLAPQHKPPGLVSLPIPWRWGGRVGGGTDGKHPPADWYVVRDDEPAGHCYFAGFDVFSKLPIGYIGRHGFRATMPARDDQFALPDTNERSLNRFIATTQYFTYYQLVYNHSLSEVGQPPQWFVYLTEGNRLWEIDLRKRTARVVFERDNLLSVAILQALESTAHASPASGEVRMKRSETVQRTSNRQTDTFFSLAVPGSSSDEQKPKYVSMIAVRAADQIILYDAASGTQRKFALPASIPNEGFAAYWVAADQLLLSYNIGYWSGGPITKLVWIDAAGSIQRESELKLAGYVSESPRTSAWSASGLVPVTIVWLVGMLVGAPLGMIQANSAADYSEAIGKVFNIAWPPFVVVLLVAIMFTFLTLRLHHKYHRSGAGVWTTFVFLLGLPGFLAYWLEQRRPKMETCDECGHIVPRDRDACAACATQFPVPPTIDTEILA